MKPMTVEQRAAVAAMLRDGATYDEIRQALNVGSNTTISNIRKAEGIPCPRRARHCRPSHESFAMYAVPYGDGHMRWEGPWAGRMPQICHAGRKVSALRVAFRMRTGRDPIGYVKSACGEAGCMAPAHVADRADREAVTSA